MIPYIIYTGLESLIKGVDACKSNLEKSSTAKIGQPTRCGDSMSTI